MRRTHHGCTLLQGVSWSVSWGWTHWETRTLVQLLPPAWCHRAAWFFARQKKKKVFCSGKEQLVLCQGQNEGKEHRVWQGGDELSPVRIFFFMHPFHSMAGANLSGGFHDPAKAPALGGIFLVAPVPVLANSGKNNLANVLCVGPNQPHVLAVCVARDSAWCKGRGCFTGAGKAGPALAELEGFKLQED